ncbi:MAG: hypothetical protein JRI41_08965 [Deltaproteobacteria bacterium]|nr:hypothetical protein [Deltaproteobacteria bacterium]
MTKIPISLVLFLFLVLPTSTLYAQQPQSANWNPDGCTLAIFPDFPGKTELQNAANLILGGICNRHDICYRNCVGAFNMGWYSHRLSCDNAFFIEFSALCAASSIATVLADFDIDSGIW